RRLQPSLPKHGSVRPPIRLMQSVVMADDATTSDVALSIAVRTPPIALRHHVDYATTPVVTSACLDALYCRGDLTCPDRSDARHRRGQGRHPQGSTPGAGGVRELGDA